MKRLLIFCLFAAVAVPLQAQMVDLYAGQHTYVGYLGMNCNGTTLGATYTLDPGYCLVETHFYAGNEPPKKGAPGRFPFSHEDLSSETCATTDPYAIDLAGHGIDPDEDIFLAAHAVVCEALGQTPDWSDYVDTIDWSAGDDGVVTISVRYPGPESYFVTTISDGGALDGVYNGYCIDTDLQINSNRGYQAIPVPAYIVDAYGDVVVNPEVMYLVNDPTAFGSVAWLINQDFENNGYHYCDVQTAIWTLLGETVASCGGRSWDRVNTLVSMAEAEGWGFTPGCNQLVPVILVPVGTDSVNIAQITIAQITFAEIDVPCRAVLGDCETAWALAENGETWNKGGGWGEYFQYFGCY